jgi:RND family efflux transporter MFP subunit
MKQTRSAMASLPSAARIFRPASLVLLCLGLAGCEPSSAPEAPARGSESAAAAAVEVTQARLSPWPLHVRVQGNLIGDEEAVIGAKVAGRVREVLVDRGMPVTQGQVLACLEPEEFELQVRQAEAQVAQVRAKLGLEPSEPDEKLDPLKAPPVVQEQALLDEALFLVERARALINQRAIAMEELQKHEMAYRVARARHATALNTVDEQIALLGLRRVELALAKQHLEDARITAPFQGIVQERQIARGVYLPAGQPVVTLVRTDPLRFQAGVPEREAARVRVGQVVTLYAEGQEEPITAKVTRISPALDPNSRTLVIEADVPNPDNRLRAGVFAQADIVVDPAAQALAVPETAVSEFAGVEKVWRVRDGRAAEQRVSTGRREGGLVEILKGLTAGDAVVADAHQRRAGPVTLTE